MQKGKESQLSPLALGLFRTDGTAPVPRMRQARVWDRVLSGALPCLYHQPETLGGAPLSPVCRGRDLGAASQEAPHPEDASRAQKLLCQGAEVICRPCLLLQSGEHFYIPTQFRVEKMSSTCYESDAVTKCWVHKAKLTVG